MAEPKNWYLVSYDVRDPARWRKVYKLMRGYGQRLQFSVFRCRLSVRAAERLRWELEQRLSVEDSLLIVPLCVKCVERISVKNRPEAWPVEEERFVVV